MAGRFLTLPLFVLVCAFGRSLPRRAPAGWTFALPLALLFLLPQAREEFAVINDRRFSGVADERAFYRDSTSLVLYRREHRLPDHKWKRQGRHIPKDAIQEISTAGFHGFYAPRTAHLVDRFALTDPLLARLPVDDPGDWRVGHYVRRLPEGYLETLAAPGTCQLTARTLCPYYERLSLVVRGELWSTRRLAAIIALNIWERPDLGQGSEATARSAF